MKKLIFALALMLCSCEGYSYLPHKGNSKEFRVIASTTDLTNFTYHAQLIGGDLLHPAIKVGGLLEMDKGSANMRGLVEYVVNKYVTVGVTGGVTNKGSALGDMMINADIPLNYIDILPFVKINHKAVSSTGAVVYFTIDKVLFNVGVNYRPPIPGHQKQLISVMVGTGLK